MTDQNILKAIKAFIKPLLSNRLYIRFSTYMEINRKEQERKSLSIGKLAYISKN